MFGGSKKKLAAANAQNQTINGDIAKSQEDVARFTAHSRIIIEDTRKIQDRVDAEQKAQEEVDAETKRLNKELESANKEDASLKELIAAAKEATAALHAEKLAVHEELFAQEEIVRKEHSKADEAAEAARAHSAVLQSEQEAERVRWQAVRDAHESLRQQADASAQRCEEAKVQSDTVKATVDVTREELRDARLAHVRLTREVEQTEARIAEQRQQHLDLEAELTTLRAKSIEAQATQGELEGKRKMRELELAGMRSSLEQRASQLQVRLDVLNGRFEAARTERERVIGEHDGVKGTMGNVVPAYFQLQKEATVKRREVEHAKRDSEILTWEHHKINRDLQMLSSCYDVGFLPPALSGVAPSSPAS